MEVSVESVFLPNQVSVWKFEVNRVRIMLRSMEHDLEKCIATPTIARDQLALVEHYQNQIIRHQEVVDEIYHDLKQTDRLIGNGKKIIQDQDRNIDSLAEMKDRMDTFHKIFYAFNRSFKAFMKSYL
jgi:hypothetical protein